MFPWVVEKKKKEKNMKTTTRNSFEKEEKGRIKKSVKVIKIKIKEEHKLSPNKMREGWSCFGVLNEQRKTVKQYPLSIQGREKGRREKKYIDTKWKQQQ